MSSIKRIDIGEFREQGFLQESNRLFFHPHGLALEATVVNPDGWQTHSTHPYVERLTSHIRSMGIHDDDAAIGEHAVSILNALFPPGSQHLSGAWDYRDDSEGVVFGDGDEGKREKAERVAAQRERHSLARSELFGLGRFIEPSSQGDIEPIGWVYPEDGDA